MGLYENQKISSSFHKTDYENDSDKDDDDWTGGNTWPFLNLPATCESVPISGQRNDESALFVVSPVLSCVYLLLLPEQRVLLPVLPLPLWQCYSKLHLLQKIDLSQVFFFFQNLESPSCVLNSLLNLKVTSLYLQALVMVILLSPCF